MAWEIALIVFFLSLTVLVYLLFPVVLKLKDTLQNVNKTISIVNKDLPELMENVQDISVTLNTVSKKVESTVDDVVELEQLFSKEIKQPLQNIANSIGMLLQILNKLFDKKRSK